MTIIPIVGRKVWYSPQEMDGTKFGEQPFDATSVYVHNDRLVNLLVTDHDGFQFRVSNAPLLQDGDAPNHLGGHCYWMPYQSKYRRPAGAPVRPKLSA